MAVAEEQRDDQPQEDIPLLGTRATADEAATDSAVAQHHSSELGRQASSSKDSIVICRICLEEDATSALEVPCACSGTQRYAHHDCIQKWVTEKVPGKWKWHTPALSSGGLEGNARCEICEQPYRGDYVVPPPPPAGIPIESLSAYLLDPGDPRLGNAHGRPGGPAFPELYVDNDLDMYNRSPGVSWCLTVVLFFLIMLALHHSLLVADGVDGSSYDTGTAGGDLPGVPPSSSAPDDSYNPDNSPGLFTIIIFLAFKAFLVAVPLYTIMRVAASQAQREARREQLEALVRGAAAYEAARYNSRQLLLAARAAASSSSQQTQPHQQQDQQTLPPDQAPSPAGAPVRSSSHATPESTPPAQPTGPSTSGSGSSGSSSTGLSSDTGSGSPSNSVPSPESTGGTSSRSIDHIVVHVGPAEPGSSMPDRARQHQQGAHQAADSTTTTATLPSVQQGPDAV